jgi:large subunit ribosomal protein L6
VSPAARSKPYEETKMSKKKYTPSRIGKLPVVVPDKVTVTIDGTNVTVKGPKGTLSREFHDVTLTQVDGAVVVASDAATNSLKAMHGLGRALLNNMVQGVSQGFTKSLEVQGVGYRIESVGKQLKFSVGFSHVVMFDIPQGVSAKVEGQTKMTLSSIDKELIGQVAAKIRAIRPPEPYKGKGIRYAGEYVRRKAGKAAGK